MSTDNADVFGWDALVRQCKADPNAVMVGAVLRPADVLAIEQARNQSARLAALVLEAESAIKYSAMPKETKNAILTLARTLAGESFAGVAATKDGVHSEPDHADLLANAPTRQPSTILIDTGDGVHPRWEPVRDEKGGE